MILPSAISGACVLRRLPRDAIRYAHARCLLLSRHATMLDMLRAARYASDAVTPGDEEDDAIIV